MTCPFKTPVKGSKPLDPESSVQVPPGIGVPPNKENKDIDLLIGSEISQIVMLASFPAHWAIRF
jgi:hypothetical protein